MQIWNIYKISKILVNYLQLCNSALYSKSDLSSFLKITFIIIKLFVTFHGLRIPFHSYLYYLFILFEYHFIKLIPNLI